MKYPNLNAFEKHLEAAMPDHLGDVYFIIAKEEYVRKRALDRLLAAVLNNQKIASELSLFTYDAERQDPMPALRELEALSFFVKKRAIVIQNADSLTKDVTEKLENYYQSPNRTVCLIFVSSTINRSTNFYKKTEKAGIILDIPEEKSWERDRLMVEWVRSEVDSHKKQISPAASQLLIKQLGTDQMLLNNEIQKLICFVGDKATIDEKDIYAICTSINIENAWQLAESLFIRDVASALRISKALLDDGVALIALLRQIRSQFQTEFQICSLLSQGGSADDVSKEFPYMKGSILEKHLQQARNYGLNNFKNALLAIDEAELQAKNSSFDPDFLAERLIIKLAT